MFFNLTRNRKTCKATLVGLAHEAKESCTGARRIETCVVPRHVNALQRGMFYYFLQTSNLSGGGAIIFSLFVFFPVQQTTIVAELTTL